ncbi:hypothetical protein DPMN_004742 [Dreissena polymorpha]|uniref:Uncharacterized protein n=1 Tax=Dreissena polymorpha TaxID=45954 RepID=A0A9D4MP20_DREPO|nr:hypothetical protein DPMN_004742 [Dreissena polymorpha]
MKIRLETDTNDDEAECDIFHVGRNEMFVTGTGPGGSSRRGVSEEVMFRLIAAVPIQEPRFQEICQYSGCNTSKYTPKRSVSQSVSQSVIKRPGNIPVLNVLAGIGLGLGQ